MAKDRIKSDNLDYCTGCKMCADVCPVGAISFIENCEGFWYPAIDDDKCIGCSVCKNKCPISNQLNALDLTEPMVYSAASRDSDVRAASTSGGIFYELSKVILSQGGVVVGSSYTDDYKHAYHTIAETPEELQKLMGTKYFQSDTANIYKIVQGFLKSGRQVLFAGTPCQNAALKCFLEKGYENLLQMDFVCNSISSPLAYRKWLEELEKKYKSAVSKVRFKDKKEGWINLNTEVYFENGKVHRENRTNSIFGKGLIKYNLYQRKSCYNCKFREIPIFSSDITVGDFWGLTDLDDYDMAKGVSLLILNTNKGQNIFESIKRNLIYKKRDIQMVIDGNPRLLKNPVYHKEREQFFERLSHKAFSECVYECTKEKFCEKKEKLDFKEIIGFIRKGDVSICQFIYLNYFSKNVERRGVAKIIPYKNSLIELNKDSRIVLYGDRNLIVGSRKLKRSKAETTIRMGKNAVFEAFHGGEMVYGTTLEIKDNAKFSTGKFGLNVGCVIVIQKQIVFGENVMCGRNCIFMDSDFHQLQTLRGKVINPPKEIKVKDHVWFTGDTRVLSGSFIGSNSIIGPKTVIKGNIADWSYVSAEAGQKVVHYTGKWSEKTNNIVFRNNNSKGRYRQILVGFGKEGREYYQLQKQYIEYIIDNNPKDSEVISFKEFVRRNPHIDEDYVFVIGSSKYFSQLYKMINDKYMNSKIVSHTDILREND